MDNLPQQIYKFAQVFSASRKRDIEKIFSDNEFETKNSRHILNWDFIYRDIANTAKSNKLIKKIEPSEDLDMDLIVDAQDVFIEWLDSIKVKKINSKRYNVYLFNFYDNRYDSIQLKVAKKKDRYIIDDIIF